MSDKIYLSLGSNIGDREANLAGAITILGNYQENSELRSASFYSSEPLFNTEQPVFLNTVVELTTTFTPFEFLDEIKNIERLLGRPSKHERNTPRIIDIDILIFGESFLETAELTIPHPGIPYRRFVLVPLNELVPNYIIPGWNISIKELLNRCTDQSKVLKHTIESNA
ncbi:MAG: 2-amino-4-hydroxy-6-hydroxymethyldihydropteridine diphosphokinase [Planctomycetia bacterium]|nr:2-amino-4-hydroxy-6-hydroxymethyldihydropteridine diphosphokinase [Planctomycetia bacterium]